VDHAISASLVLSTEAAVDLASAMAPTGLVCDESCIAGNRRVTRSGHEWPNPSERSWWRLHLPRREVWDPEPVVIEVLDLIEPVRDQFMATVRNLDLDVCVCLHIHAMPDGAAIPGGTFEPATLARIVGLGAALDLDLYCWESGTDLTSR